MKKTRQLPETGAARDPDEPFTEALPPTALDSSWPNKQETYDKDGKSQGKKGQRSDLFSTPLGQDMDIKCRKIPFVSSSSSLHAALRRENALA